MTRSAELEVRRVESDDAVSLRALLTGTGKRHYEVWFQVPSDAVDHLTDRADPFVVATILWAMEHIDELVVHGTVSTTLLRNLEEFQLVWHSWAQQRYTPVVIRPDEEVDRPAPETDVAIASFSGGVDSAFTAYRHATGRAGRRTRQIRALILVHGFDIPLDRPDAFYRAVTRARPMAESIGAELLTVKTNLRGLKQPWIDSFGTAVAASMHLFAPMATWGLIASGQPYPQMRFPVGSSALTDHLLSSNQLRVVNHGASHDRIAKLEELLSWPEALANLRVCWEGPNDEPNCGRCEKCLRTMLAFRALEQSIPPCFDHEPDLVDLRRLRHLSDLQRREMQRVLKRALDQGVDAPWVKELERCVRRNQPVHIRIPSAREVQHRARRGLRRIRQGLQRRIGSISPMEASRSDDRRPPRKNR